MKRLLFYIFLYITPSLPAFAEDGEFAQSVTQLVKNDLIIATPHGKIPFVVELAMTPEDQQVGLMNRKELGENEGMLFVMPDDRKVEMWMKDTYIPLDMFFIDSHGEIANIAANAEPLSLDVIPASRPVHAVLELPGGTAEKQGISAGDKVIHPYFKP